MKNSLTLHFLILYVIIAQRVSNVKKGLLYLKSIRYFGPRLYEMEYIKLESDREDVNSSAKVGVTIQASSGCVIDEISI